MPHAQDGRAQGQTQGAGRTHCFAEPRTANRQILLIVYFWEKTNPLFEPLFDCVFYYSHLNSILTVVCTTYYVEQESGVDSPRTKSSWPSVSVNKVLSEHKKTFI